MTNELLSSLLIVDCEVRRRIHRAKPDDAVARQLRDAMRTVSRAALSAATAEGAPLDPDLIIQGYIAAEGNWQALVAAVSRHGLDAQARRIS
jgi:hypothetical protein